MIKVLIIVFVLLSLFAGGDRTAKSLMTTAINIAIFAMLIELIYLGLTSYLRQPSLLFSSQL